ncbi:MAG: hypothetical protein H6R01_243 [Burkholderiaceae bacterium]|nr:hypothetical protein [Burkholderiaceae bacterium]
MPQNHQKQYRPDIDGLRAFAILAVIIFHAFPEKLRGGFVGVDIFFVISGFLISRIIFQSLERGDFSFCEFYARRINRIFPALIVVIVATLSFGWLALLPDELKQLGKHISGSTGFIQNIVLVKEDGYFDTASELKPLLHLWSLAIEEQYYLIYPLLVFAIWRTRLKQKMLLVISILLLISFAINIAMVKKFPVATFFLPHTRVWELLAGGVLAHFQVFKNKSFSYYLHKWNFTSFLSRRLFLLTQNEKTIKNFASAFGLFLLLTSVICVHKGKTFPGWWALAPVAGTWLTICAGPNSWVNQYVLGNRLMVFLGLISYPLYLWHWPILSYGHIIYGGMPTKKFIYFAIAISILFAWLTVKFVEKPFRFGINARNAKIVFLLALMALVGGVGFCSMKFDYAQKSKELIIKRKGEARIGTSDKWYHGKDDWLFLGNAYDKTVSKTRLVIMPSESEITTTREIFSKIAKTGADHESKVVLFVGANKSSIYPEYLPDEIKPSQKKYVDFFLDKLRDIPNLTIYNSTSDLLSAKETSGLLYWMTDTHWNNKGAFVAFTGFSKLLKLPTPQIKFQQGKTHSGDLIDISGLKDFPLHKKDNWEVVWKTQQSVTEAEIPNEPETPGGKPVIVFNQNAITDKRVWIVGDSFTGALKQYFNATFKETHYIGHWNQKLKELPARIMNADKRPDMIIIVRVERSF